MKKLIAILIIVVLVTATTAMTLPASADEGPILYKEALIQDTPDGPVVRGQVKVYEDYRAKVKIHNPDFAGVTYEVRITYGWALDRVAG